MLSLASPALGTSRTVAAYSVFRLFFYPQHTAFLIAFPEIHN